MRLARRSPRSPRWARALGLLVACAASRVASAQGPQPGAPGQGPRDGATELAPAGQLAPASVWRTEYYALRGSVPGPTVLLLAGQHGNEPAGPLAADRLLSLRLCRGSLVVVPRVNRAALAAGTRLIPGEQAADLARNFPRADGEAPRGPLATAVWDLVRSTRPDVILDLHEGFDFYRRTGRSIGSTVLHSPTPMAEALVPPILAAINSTISITEKKFAPLAKPIVGSVLEAAWRRLGITGIVLETTKAGQRLELRVDQHVLMAEALLRELAMLPLGAACDAAR